MGTTTLESHGSGPRRKSLRWLIAIVGSLGVIFAMAAAASTAAADDYKYQTAEFIGDPVLDGTTCKQAYKITVITRFDQQHDVVLDGKRQGPVVTVAGNDSYNGSATVPADGKAHQLQIIGIEPVTNTQNEVLATKTVTCQSAPSEQVIPVPKAPEVNDPCGANNATWIVPADTSSVNWTVSDGRLMASTKEGYVFSDGTKSHDYGVAKDSGTPCEPEPTSVTPKAPTVKDDSCGTANDTYTIPSTEGVDYYVGGNKLKAGTYTTGAVLSIEVTAKAQSGYVVEGDASWTLTFTNQPCEPGPAEPTGSIGEVTCKAGQASVELTFGNKGGSSTSLTWSVDGVMSFVEVPVKAGQTVSRSVELSAGRHTVAIWLYATEADVPVVEKKIEVKKCSTSSPTPKPTPTNSSPVPSGPKPTGPSRPTEVSSDGVGGMPIGVPLGGLSAIMVLGAWMVFSGRKPGRHRG